MSFFQTPSPQAARRLFLGSTGMTYDGISDRQERVDQTQAHHGHLFANARGTRIKLLVHDGLGRACPNDLKGLSKSAMNALLDTRDKQAAGHLPSLVASPCPSTCAALSIAMKRRAPTARQRVAARPWCASAKT